MTGIGVSIIPNTQVQRIAEALCADLPDDPTGASCFEEVRQRQKLFRLSRAITVRARTLLRPT